VFPARLARLGRLAELAFFPSFCKTCGTLLESPGERVMCRACLDGLVSHRAPLCPCCGRFFEGWTEDHFCGACLDDPPPFSVHRSAGRYRGVLKDAILLLKYRSFRPLGRELARFVHEALKRDDSLWPGLSVVMPVPLHRLRKRERGFNQAQAVAVDLAGIAGLPLEPKVIRKTRATAPQTSLEHSERAANVRGAYRVVRPDRIRGKIVLLVDDVYTTGATLRECAAALRAAGAEDVRALTVAQA
jgi:ComF family protein